MYRGADAGTSQEEGNEVSNAERERIFRHRLGEFPEPIQRIAHNNHLVHQIIQSYTHGQIITRDEALCQMVVCLATASEVARAELVKHYMTFTPHYFVTDP
jgi:hypothetical protein